MIGYFKDSTLKMCDIFLFFIFASFFIISGTPTEISARTIYVDGALVADVMDASLIRSTLELQGQTPILKCFKYQVLKKVVWYFEEGGVGL